MITFLCFVLLPLVFCDNNKLPHELQHVTTVRNSTEKIPLKSNMTRVTLLSEGGPIPTQRSLIDLLKNNSSSALLSLDKEIGKSKKKPSVPRKEAGVYIPETKQNSHNSTIVNNTTESHNFTKQLPSTKSNIQSNNTEKYIENKKSTTHATLDLLSKNVKAVTNNTIIPLLNTTTKPKPKMKPEIVSYENLINSFNNQSEKNNDLVPTIKIQNDIHHKSENPEMIMPIVITILVVPVFIVLSLMAFRRVREAWRNRHYKRMDFLLDGMYND